jgi:hypothetical protein
VSKVQNSLAAGSAGRLTTSNKGSGMRCKVITAGQIRSASISPRQILDGSGVLILSSCMQHDPGETAAFTIIYKPHQEINQKAI